MATLDVAKSMELLKKYDIPIARFKIVQSSEEAVKASNDIGYPVVMKIVSEQYSHKTDVGGVLVNLKGEKEVSEGYSKLSKLSPKVLIQKMASGKEVIIGVKNDSVFGPAIMFGLGGIFVELFKDVSFRICPITLDDADKMISETKASKILTGFRGSKPLDTEKLKEIMVKVSNLAVKEKVLELDINPVMVGEQEAVAVDARVVV